VTIQTCLCLITRPADGRQAGPTAGAGGVQVLLGFKKTGFGAGRWVGVGGHVEADERPVDAAVREVAEETGLVVDPAALRHMASLDFVFPFRPSWSQVAEVFVTEDFLGEPAESDELIPQWFDIDALPLAGMWDDAKHWLPLVLTGERVQAQISFAIDCATVARIYPDLPVLSRRADHAGFSLDAMPD